MRAINKNSTWIISLLILGVSFIGCKKDFLDTDPKGLLIAEKTADYDLLLNAESIRGQALASHILMSDELAGYAPLFSVLGTGTFRLSDQKAFRWEDDIYLADDNYSEFNSLVRQLYYYNKIINEVLDAKEGTESQKKSIRSEALAGRAYSHFMLVNYYGKPYNEATAASDLAAPIYKIADVTQTAFTRATVKEMYEQIVADLTAAIPDLPQKAGSRIRMSRSAGEALLGKVYVYMGKFDLALPLLDAALKDLAGASIPVGLYDYNKELANGGVFTPVNPFIGPARGMDPYADEEILYLKFTSNLYVYLASGIMLNPQTVKSFANTDLRKQFMSNFTFGMTAMYPQDMQRAWGRGGLTNLGVNIPDIYLLLAECKARLGDLNGAVENLMTLRKNRMPSDEAGVPPAITTDKIKLTQFILEERIREFFMSGERWWDMRRLSVDPDHKGTVGDTHQLYDKDGKVTATYKLKPERLAFRFPLYILQSNPAMQQNP
ncbi:RagB/SusD family nutrient uptake outer membrane protein [Sphingobacterium sp. BIGb0165]|uniref:RagB/SusD family nutrient uptake outer membrane protein n=1 Tax=Sphingobacterium sp. BIGb0165 TaxID=2940615 RepID=UPI00216A31F5|nr:RagB/SusD family nutrient uptake outer membrane protein [Sphingobacterium sp. BIGb0165]MCS4226964.1 tetratricopeptide (TPR) repeat protein [Sphingobacterium sp. BIGb0165]